MARPSDSRGLAERYRWQYIALSVCFLIAVAYQSQVTETVLRHNEYPRAPFTIGEDGLKLAEEARADGMQPGDRVMAVDGIPFRGEAVLGDLRKQRHAGDVLRVELLR